MNPHRLVANHRFDGVRQHEFALSAPRVNGAARLLVGQFGFHNGLFSIRQGPTTIVNRLKQF